MFKLLELWKSAFILSMGGGGGGTQTSVQQNFSPEEAAQRAKVQTEASRLYNETAGTIASSPYTGAAPVPYSADTMTGQNLAKAAANTQINSTIPDMNAATSFGLTKAADVQSNPYLQHAIDAAIRPITQSYTDPNGVMSNIRTESMNNGGQGTSTRQGIAEGVAAGRYADAIGGVASSMANTGYNSGMDTMTKTLGLTPQTMTAMSSPASLYGTVGAQNENLAQAQQQYMSDAKNWDLNAAWAPLQNWANIVYGGTGPSSTTSTSTGGGSRSNPFMSAAGGALTGYQLGTMGGATFGPAGAIGGAILGGLFG